MHPKYIKGINIFASSSPCPYPWNNTHTIMNKLENAAFDIDYKNSRVFCGSSKAEVNKTGCLSSSMPSVSLSTVIIPKRIEVPARNIKSVYVSCVRLAWTSAAVCARTWNWNAIICHITLRQKKLATVKIISFIERNRLIYQFWIIYSSRIVVLWRQL